MANLEKIAVELVAKVDGLNAGFSQATRMAEQAGNRMQRAFSGVTTALASVAGALAAGFSVQWIGGLIKDSINAAANLKGLSEQTGVAAGTLAKLDIAARISGVGIDTVAQSMNRLAKMMSWVDEDSKGIPKALKAIGLNFSEFKELDPDAQMLAIAKAFDGFEDGAGKSAVAMALFGKEGARLIPFFKDLIENQALSAGRTQEMIDAADKFSKKINLLKIIGGDLLAQTLAPMVPILDDLSKMMLDAAQNTGRLEEASRALSGSSEIETWADKAVHYLALVANAGDGVTRVFSVVSKAVAGMAAVTSNALSGVSALDLAAGAANPMGPGGINLARKIAANRAAMNAAARAASEGVQDDLTRELAGDTMLRGLKKAANNRLLAEAFGPAGAVKKGKIRYNEPSDGGGKKVGDFERVTNSLREKIAVQNEELNVTEKLADAEREYAKFRAQVANNTIKLSPQEMEAAERLWAQFKDGAEKLKAKAQQKVTDAARVGITELAESFGRENQKVLASFDILPAAAMEAMEKIAAVDEKARTEKARLADLQAKGNISLEQRIALEKELADVIDRQKEKVNELAAIEEKNRGTFEFGARKALRGYLDEIEDVAASSQALLSSAFKGAEDALVSFVQTGKLDFKSLINSMIADLARLTIRQSITGPIAEFVGSMFGGGGRIYGADTRNALGGVYSGAGIGAYSGQVVSRPTVFPFAKGIGLMGEAGPEAILPLKRGSDGKLGVTASGGGQEVNISIVVNKDGSDASSAQGDEAGAWQRVADRVKAVVREEMMAQKRPGGVLYA